MSTNPNRYARESNEFQSILATRNNIPITTGVKVAVLVPGVRPTPSTVWVNPVALDGGIGVMTGGHDRGSWAVWVQITADPEVIVINCGYFTTT